ncbi:MAG: hypothetical protein IJQ20_02990 [Paludibacteraceae bacterium]|nr:hypothetical protein [Paludibacteraceae bacterium]
MKRIKTSGKDLLLPEDWMELSEKQRRKGFELLAAVMANAMDPFEWQLYMLVEITGYKPSRATRRALFGYKQHTVRDTVIENLRRLAECLDFAFTIEDNEVKIKYEMHDCPFDLFKGKGVQPHFVRDRLIETNLTAGIYAEATQILSMVNDKDNDDADRMYYMSKLAKTLWRVEMNAHAPEPTPVELLAVTVWFTGVVLFFQEHDIYSVLFDSTGSDKSKSEDYISLGVQEIVLELETTGHRDVRNMGLLEFFDAQIKLLKDRIAEAKSGGSSVADIVKKTGLSINTITRLS